MKCQMGTYCSVIGLFPYKKQAEIEYWPYSVVNVRYVVLYLQLQKIFFTAMTSI